MIRVCFANTGFPMDDVVHEALRNTLEHLADTHCHIEFWYNNCHQDFERSSVEYILELQNKYPDKQFDIIAVLDPLRNDPKGVLDYSFTKRDENGYPLGSVSRYEYAPYLVGKSEQHYNRFITHHKKIVRWVRENCDILIAYHYDNINDTLNTDIKRLKKIQKPEVISIYNPERYKQIDAHLELLPDRERTIILGLRNGRSYKSLSEEFGVSQERIRTIANSTGRRLYYGKK